MNLQGKINVIKDAKDDIKAAIIAKGITPSGNISTYADAIEQINTVNNTSLSVTPSTTSQTLRPSGDYTGYGVVNVGAVTASIDNNIVENNIKQGCEILGVSGNVVELNGQTKTITESGTYTPDSGYNGFTEVSVNVPPRANYVKNIGSVYTIFPARLSPLATDLSVDISATYQGTSITEINYDALETISGQGGFSDNNIFRGYGTKASFSNLKSISGGGFGLRSLFSSSYYLTQIDFSKLTSITLNVAFGITFQGCTSLPSVVFPSLSNISAGNCFFGTFSGCTSLTSLFFPSLNSNSFGSYTDQFERMLAGVTGCTVHFPSNLQSVIGSWNDVVSGFGGTNTTVLFDLPATT